MHTPDLKKLITSFLIIAAIASSSALAISEFIPRIRGAPAKDTASLGFKFQNAFRPAGPDENSLKQENLTRNLAENIAAEIISQNQNGPLTFGDTSSISVPSDLENLVSKYISESDLTHIALPHVDENRIKIKKEFAPENVAEYLNNLKIILEEAYAGTEFRELEKKSRDELSAGPELATAHVIFYSQLEVKLYDLAAPAPFEKLHRELITFVKIPQFAFGQNIYNDPLAAMSAVKTAQELLATNSENIEKEIQFLKVVLPRTVGVSHNDVLENIFIRRAYAFTFVDFVNLIQNTINAIESKYQSILKTIDVNIQTESWLGKLITEVLKDKLLTLVVNSIINWANGGAGGQPAYVTDWNKFLRDSLSAGAGQVIDQIAPSFCSPYRGLLEKQLREQYGATGAKNILSGTSNCTLDHVVSNVQQFYTDFSAGGWAGYAALTEPGGNYYSAKLLAQAAVNQKAEAAKEAAKSEAIAGKGYTGTKMCLDGSSPSQGPSQDGGIIQPCADGSNPQTTTPGANIADTVSKAIPSSIERIVNAENWQSLSVQLAKFAVTKLINSGNKGLRGGNITGDNGATTLDPYAVCNGYTPDSEDYTNCKTNVDSAQNPGGSNASGIKNTILTQGKQALADWKDARDSLDTAMDASNAILGVLEEIIKNESACVNEAVQARAEKQIILGQQTDFQTRKSEIESKILALTAFLAEVESHTPQNDPDYFNGKFTEFNFTFNPIIAARDKADTAGEVSSMESKLQSASDLLKACIAH